MDTTRRIKLLLDDVVGAPEKKTKLFMTLVFNIQMSGVGYEKALNNK